MTDKNSPLTADDDDQTPFEFKYGHGRMPFFMKVVWVAFLALATWYIVAFLLEAVGAELA